MPPLFHQLHREEAARNELEAKLNTTNDQLEELQKKYDTAVREKDDEIRQLKEEVRMCMFVCVCHSVYDTEKSNLT